MALRKDLRLLVVDDMAVSRLLLIQLLERLGLVDVRAAGSADEALQHLAVRPVDIVIADLNMPGMDGGSLLRRVRSDRRSHAAGFVLTSGNDSDPRIETARLQGMDRFLPKPFSASALLGALEGIVGRL